MSQEETYKVTESCASETVESKAAEDKAAESKAAEDKAAGSKAAEDKAAGSKAEEGKATLPDLFWTFVRVGGLTFGGGVAMLPMLQKEVVENKHWATEEEMMDYYAIGQCTPGIIAVNCATFIGSKKRGVKGGIIATFGVVFPSLVIIMILAGLIANFADIPVVKSAFAGIRVAVCVLVLSACIKLLKKAVIDLWTFLIFLLVGLGSYFLGISPVLYVIVAAGLGIAIRVLKEKKETNKESEQMKQEEMK